MNNQCTMTLERLTDEIIVLMGGNGLSTNESKKAIFALLQETVILRPSSVFSDSGVRSLDARQTEALD